MYPVSERFQATITGSHLAVVRARVCPPGQTGPDPVGEDVAILGGDLQMDASAEVKASLDVTVPGDWWDETLPLGAELWVARGVAYGDGTDELVPLGYFRIESVEQDDQPNGPVRVSAKDRTAQLQQNRPVVPWQVPAGTTHRAAFQRIVNGVGGGLAAYPGRTVQIIWRHYNPDLFTVPDGTTVEDDACGFLADLAADRGATLVFDELGQLQVVAADPDPETVPASYTVTPGAGGVLVRASRKASREGVYNIVTAYGSDPAFPTGYQTAYLTDVGSPLRHSGAFGPSPRFFSSPLLRSSDGAAEAARTRLARATGLPTTLALYTVPNPAVRPLTVVSATVGRQTSAHVIESVRVPLLIGGDSSPLEIVTRQLNTPAEIVSDPAPVPTPEPLPDPDNPGGGGGGVGPDPADDTDDNGAGGGGTPAHPGDALWIGPQLGKQHYNVGIGTDAHRDTDQTAISGGWTSDNFKLSDDKQWVNFKVRADGARTSSNTKYPRSELREFNESNARAAWPSSGTHIMRSTWRVTQAGNGSKPWVNVQQIHDAEDDVLRLMVEGSSLGALKVSAILRDVRTTVLSSYTLGQAVTTTIEVVNGDLKIYLGDEKTGTVVLDEPDAINSGNYYKAGCYPNSNTDTEGSSSSVFEAGIKSGSFYTWHTGYATPTTPPWKTSGGGGPVVGDGSATPLATQAAQLILDRLNSGLAIYDDWTWDGCPPLVNAYNDTLQALWVGDGSPNAITWLTTYIGNHSEPDPGGGGTDPGGTAVPVGQTTVLAEDFTGNLAAWNSVQTRLYDGSAASYATTGNYPLQLVAGGGRLAVLRTELRDGDTAAGTHERAELSGFGKAGTRDSGDECWYEFSVRFGDPTWSPSWTGGTNDWLIFFQVHAESADGAPPLALAVRSDDRVHLQLEPDDVAQPRIPVWNVRPGEWERVVLHVKWSPDPAVGFVECHVNGVQAVPKTFRQTAYASDPDNAYPKLGQYRRNTVGGTTVVMHSGFRLSAPPATSGGTTTPPPVLGDGTQAAVQLGWGPVVAGDEFDYTGRPDSAKWSVYNGEGHSGNGLRRPSAFDVANGVLVCTGDNVSGGTTGGMALRRNERYCRLEARIRVYSINPAGSGNRYHPVLLMWPQSEEWPEGGEIDYFETNVDSGKLGWFVHYPNHQPKTQEGGTQALDIQNWHNYALEWSPSGIRAWVDGVQYFNYTMSAIQPPGPMHFCAQLDNYDGENMEPARLECQWVRVYNRPGA